MLINGRDIRIIHATTGQLLRELILNPAVDYQARGARMPRPKPSWGFKASGLSCDITYAGTKSPDFRQWHPHGALHDHGRVPALTRVSQTSNRKLYDAADELIRQSVISDVAGPSGAPPVSLELARSDGSRSEPPDLVQTGSGYPAERTPSMP